MVVDGIGELGSLPWAATVMDRSSYRAKARLRARAKPVATRALLAELAAIAR